MAQFDAQINLEVQIEKALQGVKKVEAAIAKIAKTTIDFGAQDLKDAQKSISNIGRIAKAASSGVKNLGRAAGFAFNNFNKLAGTLALVEVASFANNFKQLQTPLSKFAALATSTVDKVLELGAGVAAAAASAPLLSAGIAAAAVGLVAFAPQLKTVTGRLLKLSSAAGTAKQAFLTVFNAYNKLSGAMDAPFLDDSIPDATRLLEAYRKALKDVSQTVSELGRRKNNLKAELDKWNSSSDTAAKISRKLVSVTAAYNAELREQEDLLRRTKGITQSTLEESKAVKSLETKRRRASYLEEQETKVKREQKALEEALFAIQGREQSLLQQTLGIEKQITNEKVLQAQAEKNKQFQGQSMRIPTPYTNAAAQGFPGVALPQTRQEAKIAAAERARAEAKVALERQKSNSLLAQGVTDLRLQIALAEKLKGAYSQIVETLKRQNRRQGQLARGRANRQTRGDLGGVNSQVLDKINKLQTNSVTKEKLKNQLFKSGAAIKKNEFETAKAITAEVEQQIRLEQKRISQAQRLIKFRKKQRAERKADRANLNENLALGAGFPLLFGGGPGAVLGGVAGAFTGKKGGFGMQILLSALGTQIDTFVQEMLQKAKDLAPAFESLAKSFDILSEASLISTRAEEKRIKALKEQGLVIESNIQAQKDFVRQFGQESVDNIRELGDSLDKADRAFAALGIRLLNLLNGPLKRFIDAGADVANFAAFPTDINAAAGQLQPGARDAFIKDFRKIQRELLLEREKKGGQLNVGEALDIDRQALQQAIDKYAPFKLEVEVELTNQEKFQRSLESLQNQVKIPRGQLGLLDKFDAARKLIEGDDKQAQKNAELAQRAADARLQAERRNFDARLRMERRIEDVRLNTINKENALLDQQARNRLARFDVETLKQKGDRVGSDASSEAKALIDAARNVQRVEIETEEEKARVKRNSELEIQRFELQVARTVFDAKLQAARANEDAARTELEINRKINQEKEEFDQRRFNLEKEILALEIQIQKTELMILAEQQQLNEAQRAYLDTFISDAERMVGMLQNATAPAQTAAQGVDPGSFGRVGTGDLSGFESAAERYKSVLRELEAATIEGSEIKLQAATQRMLNAAAALKNAFDPDEVLKERLQELKDKERVDVFKAKGYRDSDAEKLAAGEKELVKQSEQLVANYKLVEQYRDNFAIDSEPYKVLNNTLKDMRVQMDNLNKSAKQFENTFDPNGRMKDTLDELIGTINNELASAMSNALLATIEAAVTGADDLDKKLQDIAAQLLKTLSQILMQAAIAAAMGPGGFFGPKGLPGFRAKGGPVSSNEPYIVGEKGPELFLPKESGTIVPNNRLAEAMEKLAEPRMSGGDVMVNRPYKVGEAGPELMIPENGSNPYDVARASMVSGGKTVQVKTSEKKEEERYEELNNSLSNDMNIRYESTVINNQSYVTEEQFQKGLRAGVKQARSETMKQFRNRPAVRSKAGI